MSTTSRTRKKKVFKTFAAGLATALVASAALVAMPVAAVAAEVSIVADFEDGTLGPLQQSGGGASTLSVIDLDGGKVLRVAGRDADYVGVQTAPGALGAVAAGDTVTASMRVKLTDGTAGTAGVRFVMKPAYTWIGNTDMSAAEWTTVSGTYIVPAGADPAALQLYIGTGGEPGTYDYLVDDLRVSAQTSAAPSATVISTDFEEGLDGWIPRDNGSGAPTVTIVTDVAHSGTQSALVGGRTSQGSGLGHDVTGLLETGVLYEASAWVRFAPGTPTDDVWLTMARTVNGSTTYQGLGQFSGMSNSEWVKVTQTFTMGAADQAFIYFETNYNGTNTSDFLIDDIVVRTPQPAVIEDLTPVKDTVDFAFGVAVDSRETVGAPSELLLKHADQVTSENFMKPEAWYNAAGEFTPNAEADSLMQYAIDNDLAVYGHTLVWHGQTPAFFFETSAGTPLTTSDADKQILRDRMRTHIFAVAKHLSDTYGAFGGGENPLYAFDVVNEVVSDGFENADGLRRSEWYRVLGEEFIDLAFIYADQAFNDVYAAAGADRPVTLFINDYNTEQTGKQQRYHDLVARMLARGVPLDGVGHQFHVSLSMPVSALENAIVAFEDLPVTQAVTELDVTTGTPVTEALLVEQGYYYRDAFRAFRAHTDDLFSVTVWGLTDGRSWRAGSGDPLLFNDSLTAKPAYYGAVDAELPARLRTAIVFGGDIPLAASATTSPEWRRLPLNRIDDTAAFQLRWSADHLTAYVRVDDATVHSIDGVEFSVADTTVAVPRTGAAGAIVTERAGGYDMVVHLPVTATLGDQVKFDIRVTDGATTSGWNTPGELGTLALVEPLSFVQVEAAPSAVTIDGTVDSAWSAARVITTDKQVSGTGGATATVRTLWSGSKLYVLADVADPTIDVTGSDPWTQDSVEIFVDAGNVKSGYYRYDDTQIRISATNVVSFGTGDEAFQANRVRSATSVIDGGYRIEAEIDLLEAGGLGSFQGLDIQVNDASNGQRTSVRTWADPTGAGFQSTARWGVGELVKSLPAIDVVRAPKITGSAKVGKTVGVQDGKWSVKKVQLAYQWNRDGQPIAGATGDTYRATAADSGTFLTVTVTAKAAGYSNGVATSDPVTVQGSKPGKAD
ncbi:MAG: endo-1,4-beta-xylanase [Rhodoglobus sp.]